MRRDCPKSRINPNCNHNNIKLAKKSVFLRGNFLFSNHFCVEKISENPYIITIHSCTIGIGVERYNT